MTHFQNYGKNKWYITYNKAIQLPQLNTRTNQQRIQQRAMDKEPDNKEQAILPSGSCLPSCSSLFINSSKFCNKVAHKEGILPFPTLRLPVEDES